MQYTQEQVEKYFVDRGCRLLSSYKNVKSPIRYIGVCGHVVDAASFEIVRRPTCSFKCMACSPKITYTDGEVAAYVSAQGCELLGITRKTHEGNGRTYKTIRIICACGHEHELTFEKFKAGRGRICPKCARPRGEAHFAFNPRLTDEDRTRNRDLMANIVWRRSVYERDGYTCQACSDATGNNLVAHHLNAWAEYPEQRYDLANGVTLCETCHKAFHHEYGYGHNTEAQYIAWLKRDNTEVITGTKKPVTP